MSNIWTIQKVWYEKLKKEGFEDLESFDQKGEPKEILKTTVKPLPHGWENAEQYYTYCRRYLHTGTFKSQTEREVWEMFSEGSSQREISRKLDLKRNTVLVTIEIHKELMRRTIEQGL